MQADTQLMCRIAKEAFAKASFSDEDRARLKAWYDKAHEGKKPGINLMPTFNDENKAKLKAWYDKEHQGKKPGIHPVTLGVGGVLTGALINELIRSQYPGIGSSVSEFLRKNVPNPFASNTGTK